MTFATADISDADPQASRLCTAALSDYGRRRTFWGQAVTLKVRDDHRAGVKVCMEPGDGKILVIDGGESSTVALFGGTMASIALRNGWAGAIVYGAIRDTEEMAIYDLGVKALRTNPRSSPVQTSYERDVAVHFGNVTFHSGDWIYADADGILVRQAKYEPRPVVYQV